MAERCMAGAGCGNQHAEQSGSVPSTSADTMTAMPELESLLYDESDGVAWVTLNRPEALNAFDTTMQEELRSPVGHAPDQR